MTGEASIGTPGRLNLDPHTFFLGPISRPLLEVVIMVRGWSPLSLVRSGRNSRDVNIVVLERQETRGVSGNPSGLERPFICRTRGDMIDHKFWPRCHGQNRLCRQNGRAPLVFDDGCNLANEKTAVNGGSTTPRGGLRVHLFRQPPASGLRRRFRTRDARVKRAEQAPLSSGNSQVPAFVAMHLFGTRTKI